MSSIARRLLRWNPPLKQASLGNFEKHLCQRFCILRGMPLITPRPTHITLGAADSGTCQGVILTTCFSKLGLH